MQQASELKSLFKIKHHTALLKSGLPPFLNLLNGFVYEGKEILSDN